MMMMKGTREVGGRKETGLWTIYPSGFGMGVFLEHVVVWNNNN